MKGILRPFAIDLQCTHCDDIAAGANTLEELYELYEALVCCCWKAGIQIKAGKVKFEVKSITFHNYIISELGTEPKEANLCSIRNMSSLKDIPQIRAFLGCCQQLSHYIKDYGIIEHNQERSKMSSSMDSRIRL